jgi:hypothetical protein
MAHVVEARTVSTGWMDVGCSAQMKAVCKVARVAIYP